MGFKNYIQNNYNLEMIKERELFSAVFWVRNYSKLSSKLENILQ
jgi:hypothetical protein